MNLFDSLMGSAGIALLMDTQGRSVTYFAEGSGEVTLTAIVGDEQAETKEAGPRAPRLKVRTRLVTIGRGTSLPYRGVASPRLGAIVTIDGVKYALTSIVSQDATSSLVKVERSESREALSGDLR